MDKRLWKHQQQHQALCEKRGVGCMWGFIGLLHFHHPDGSSTSISKKVAVDGNPSSINTIGGYLRSRSIRLQSKFWGSCQGIDDVVNSNTIAIDDGRKNMKKLMQEEMWRKNSVSKRTTNVIKLKQVHIGSGTSVRLRQRKKLKRIYHRTYQKNLRHSGMIVTNASVKQFVDWKKELFQEIRKTSHSLMEKQIRDLKNSSRSPKSIRSECGVLSTNVFEEAKAAVEKPKKQNAGSFLKKMKAMYGYLNGTYDTKTSRGSGNVIGGIISKKFAIEKSVISPSDAKNADKNESDINLEAKRHISARLRNVDEVKTCLGKKVPTTLLKIIASHEHKLSGVEDQPCNGNARDFNGVEVPVELKSAQFTSPGKCTAAEIRSAEFEYTKCSRPDQLSGNQPLTNSVNASSPRVSSSCMIEEYPSPDSVLDLPYFAGEVANFRRTKLNFELPVQPLHIDFEGQCSYSASPTSTYSDDKKCVSKCIITVLNSLGLNWDAVSMEWRSSDQLLEPYLFEELQLCTAANCCDHRLLFDSINETLVEGYEHHQRRSHWVTFIKRTVPPVSLMDCLVREAIEGLNRYLVPTMTPRKLEQIVRDEVAKPGKFLDIRDDTEYVVVEMAEAILEELAMETAEEIQI